MKWLIFSIFLLFEISNALSDTTLVQYGFDSSLPSAKESF